jgi:two-component system, cell cycle response regulator
MKFNPAHFLFKKCLTTKQVVIRILCIELLMEFFIMLLFSVIPYEFSTVTGAVLDSFLLVILTTPAIYFFVIKPFVEVSDEAIVHINHLVHTDSLTKLANRDLILEYIELLAKSNAAHKNYAAVLLVDVDGIMLINDSHGLEAGDAALVKVGERLKSNVRGEDVVGRLGGAVYVVLLRMLGSDDKIAHHIAQFVADKLITQVVSPINFENKVLKVGANIGVRLFGAEQSDAPQLIRDAETAMLHASEIGKGSTIFFDV